MEWTLDTGSKGAVGCAPGELKALLEAEADHFSKTFVEQQGGIPFLAASKEMKENAATLQQLSEKSQKLKDKAAKKLPAVQAQMAKAIEAACSLAATYSGNVVVTIKGHVDPNHGSGVADRLTVSVDAAPHVEADEDE